MKKTCFNCKHCGADPDGPYCVHPTVLEYNPYGTHLNVASGAEYMKDDPLDKRSELPYFGFYTVDGMEGWEHR